MVFCHLTTQVIEDPSIHFMGEDDEVDQTFDSFLAKFLSEEVEN
jgi:hypothetical protein